MTIAYWIVASVAALAFVFAGGMKIAGPESALRDKGVLPERRTMARERAIGAVEVVGALGLILPPLTGIAPVLAPIAATGLVIVMVLAVVNHRSHGEPINGTLVPGALALVTAVLGFIVWI
ncbi:DoxX family protein [Demequina activiva]|uniref:Membrane protein n=1 Tax=Demequina activiva TaxID=1582364 RepID=A0A919Q328_9MICO|nr:DoxX family protein [Demequina activiva]GIG53528.1 membrane protein [Demequina activiva]